MEMRRRDLLKVAAAGGAALALPLERVGFTSSAPRMATSKMPKQFSLPFRRPPELNPVDWYSMPGFDGVERRYPRYQIWQTFDVAEIMPGYKTPIFGYNGITPGPTIRVHHDTPIVVDETNLLHRPPAAPYQS